MGNQMTLNAEATLAAIPQQQLHNVKLALQQHVWSETRQKLASGSKHHSLNFSVYMQPQCG